MENNSVLPPAATLSENPHVAHSEALQAFQDLIEIVAKLRGPDGCPWDKEQNQKSLTRYIIEEAFELAEAIDSGDQKHIQEELGDYLFQVILQAQVAADEKLFQLTDILKTLNEKMIRRHPHVFAASSVANSQDVKAQWEAIKALENAGKAKAPARLAKDLRGFPALLTALKIGHRSEEWRFDWDSAEQVEAKVIEEMAEVKEAKALKTQNDVEEEIGDLLFAVVQWARHLKVEPESALRNANLKFEKRFHKMLEVAQLDKQTFAALPLSAKEAFWASAKNIVSSENI